MTEEVYGGGKTAIKRHHLCDTTINFEMIVSRNEVVSSKGKLLETIKAVRLQFTENDTVFTETTVLTQTTNTCKQQHRDSKNLGDDKKACPG